MIRINRETIQMICSAIEEQAGGDSDVSLGLAGFLRDNIELVEKLFEQPLPKARVVTVKVIDVRELQPKDGNHRYLIARPHRSAVLKYSDHVVRADGMLVIVGHWDVDQAEVLENMGIDDELAQEGQKPPVTAGRPLNH